MHAFISDLVGRRPVHAPVALVVAHPDDETIAAGGSLHLLREVLLVHVTDGAPRRLADAQAAGFATPSAYGLVRRRELEAALAISGASPTRADLGVPDQDASADIPGIAQQLGHLFAQHRIEAVLTHAYEGGHPDHDATALAVHLAAGSMPVCEFAGYHAGPNGGLRTGFFLAPAYSGGADHPSPPLTRQQQMERLGFTVTLSPEHAARKRAMLACFRTQAAILANFATTQERFRPAPAYDFTVAPHDGMLNYEHWGWEMTGARWRALASAALGRQCAA